jgi:hypothetical protein
MKSMYILYLHACACKEIDIYEYERANNYRRRLKPFGKKNK